MAGLELPAWERGGPNDPSVVFDALRDVLYLVKEELSPWGWRAYAMEFRERMKAEKKLQALNTLPDSGAEPSDGVVQGTPLWQERIDKMLLVEHLKKKLMTAHGEFVEASQLLLKSHAWLVKQALLADSFVVSITHVPPSKSERLDLLQAALLRSKEETREAREELEDFKIELRRKREAWRKRMIANQEVALKRQLCDQTTVSWSYAAQRSIAMRLSQVRRVMETRVQSLEIGLSSRTEELEESQRQWDEEKEALTADRDKFVKLYNRMVKAHEQAMEDLKQSQGTAEDMAKMIQVLSTEKHRLTAQVEELEEDKRRMTKQLAELRDEAKLREACTLEATLRDDLAACQHELAASRSREARGLRERAREEELRHTVERERDRLLEGTRVLEATLTHTLEQAELTIQDVMDRAKRELEQFKNEELAKVRSEFMGRIEDLERKNRMLMAEVTAGDEVAPHLPVLNPLVSDQSRMCASCRKAFIFEGTLAEEDGKG